MGEVLPSVYAACKMTTDQLTDEELNAIYMVAMLESNPKHVMGYEKAAPLFTEENGTRMHETAKDALTVIWEERIGYQLTS